MATGTGGGLLETPKATSVFKHEILNQYISPFVGKVGSRATGGRVVLVDGFAGRGRFPDGSPASAEQFLRVAEQRRGGPTVVRLFERDQVSFTALEAVVDEYRPKGVDGRAQLMDVQDGLRSVLAESADVPLFLFLDPCGANLPFDTLVDTLGRQRPDRWPPTEALLNLSADFTRSIAGVLHKGLDASGLQTMDRVVGGAWWRALALEEHSRSGDGSWGSAANTVAAEYGRRLGQATEMGGSVTPVRRRPGHQPIYHLVFLTRNPEGQWVFSAALAKARQAWLRFTGPLPDDDQDPLFDFDPVGDLIKAEQDRARARVQAAADDLCAQGAAFRPVDVTAQLLGPDYGVVEEKVVNAVLRDFVACKRLVREPGKRPHQALYTPVPSG